MNNFGVIEVAGPKTAATPGWAYVADAAPIQQAASTGRKRAAARGQGLSLSDQSAREEAKIRKELEGLDREGSRDVVIPVPAKGRVQGKHTPNVRKILQSNKTFANHLDDFEAMQALAENNPSANHQFTAREPPTKQSNPSRRKQSASRASSATARSTPRPQAQKESLTSDAPPVLAPLGKKDVKMEDCPSETPRPASKLPEGVGDVETLLQPRVPEMPRDSELRALLAGPPLTYSQARGDWDEDDRRYPPRMFCSVCGYWGRVKCVKCGTRVCALECLDVHREECVTRYGL